MSTKENHIYFWGALGISLLLLALFKTIYPYPNVVMDSYYYIRAAVNNADVNAWPIGYSRFLQFVGIFTHSHLALVAVQYIFLELSLIALFFTLRQIFRLGRLTSIVLFIFFFVNPLFLYTANLIMADTLFIGLSALWGTQLLWIIYGPRPYMIFTHALLLILCFMLRYNALYYPVIGAIAFLLSKQPLRLKLAGIILPALLVVSFITYTSGKMEEYCGVRQFSPFGGWKLVNDALFMYPHIQHGASDTMPKRFQAADYIVRQYFALTRDSGDLMKVEEFHGSPYMFDGPLLDYMIWLYRDTTLSGKLRNWSSLGPFCAAYGTYLIRNHPMAFARWFLWPNVQRYVYPPGEIYTTITSFHLRPDELGSYVRQWFGVTTLMPKPEYIDMRLIILSPYPILFCLVHACFILSLLGFLLNRGWSSIGKPYNYCLLIIICYWLCDMGFSLTAAAIVLRYQILTIIFEFSLSLFFLEYIYRYADRTSSKPLYLPFQKAYDHESLERLPGKE
ncbi:MAG TPA: hypothetical protein VHD83_05905 [Puia sp.]|nr:hypothetical protein [Puia sp.]